MPSRPSGAAEASASSAAGAAAAASSSSSASAAAGWKPHARPSPSSSASAAAFKPSPSAPSRGGGSRSSAPQSSHSNVLLRGPLGRLHKDEARGTRCRSVDAFEKICKVGEGTFGDVYKARDRQSGDIVALKQVKIKESMQNEEGFPPTALREINILLSLDHPHVIQAREMVVGETSDKIFMVMDFMEHDLKQLMGVMRQPFTASEVKRLMLDLTSALDYCHSRWVFHRDLKTSNLLINNKGQVRICDFGLARYYHEPQRTYSPTVVTLWYRAPEVLLADGGKGVRTMYGPAIDVWSLGCIFAELILGQPLMAGHGEIDQVKKLFELLGTPDETTWPGCSELYFLAKYKQRPQPFHRLRDRFKRGASFTSATALSDAGLDLMSHMLTLNPSKRTSASESLRHRYFGEEPRPKEHYLMPTFPSSHPSGQQQQQRR